MEKEDTTVLGMMNYIYNQVIKEGTGHIKPHNSIESYIESLPPASQNNSRKIIRDAIKWADRQRSKTFANAILNEKYGIDLQPDKIDGYDDGEPPMSYEE